MRLFKKILTFIFEPLKAFANRNIAEKISSFFFKNKWMIYVLSAIITLLILTITYILNVNW